MPSYRVKVICLDEMQIPYVTHLADLGSSIRDIYLAESLGQVDLKLELVQSPVLSGSIAYATPAQLSQVAESHLHNSKNAITELGLILAPRFHRDAYSKNPTWLGIMFDTSLKVDGEEFTRGEGNMPRECCAIFTSSIQAYATTRKISMGRALARTAVHEIGHLFNLQHPSEGSFFMTQSGSITNDLTAYSRFSDADRKTLRMLHDPAYAFALPGRNEFGDVHNH